MVFLWFSHSNLHFPMVFLWFSPFKPPFSYGFPMVFPSDTTFSIGKVTPCTIHVPQRDCPEFECLGQPSPGYRWMPHGTTGKNPGDFADSEPPNKEKTYVCVDKLINGWWLVNLMMVGKLINGYLYQYQNLSKEGLIQVDLCQEKGP